MVFARQLSKNRIFSLLCVFCVSTALSAGGKGTLNKIKRRLTSSLANAIKSAGEKKHGAANSKFHSKTLPKKIQEALDSDDVVRGINGDIANSSPLHEAILVNCGLCTMKLLEAGASITQRDPDNNNATPLQLAIRYGSIDAAAAMLMYVRDNECLASVLQARDSENQPFVLEFGRPIRHMRNIADKTLKIKSQQKRAKKSFQDKDVEIMRNRTQMLKDLILFKPDIVNIFYPASLKHKTLLDDEFNDPDRQPYIENREEGESRLPITLGFLLNRYDVYLRNHSKKMQYGKNKNEVLTVHVGHILKQIQLMKKMTKDPMSVVKEAEQKKAKRHSIALEAGAFRRPSESAIIPITQITTTDDESGHSMGSSCQTQALTQENLVNHAKATANLQFVTDHYRQMVRDKHCQGFYSGILRQLGVNRSDAQTAESGNWNVRIDAGNRVLKTLLKWIPFVGSGASATAQLYAEEVKHKELLANYQSLLQIAPTAAIFDHVLEQVILRIIASDPGAFGPGASYNTLPEVFRIADINEQARRGIENKELESLVLLRINKTLFDLREDLERITLPQDKVEMILKNLLGEKYERLDTTALETSVQPLPNSAPPPSEAVIQRRSSGPRSSSMSVRQKFALLQWNKELPANEYTMLVEMVEKHPETTTDELNELGRMLLEDVRHSVTTVTAVVVVKNSRFTELDDAENDDSVLNRNSNQSSKHVSPDSPGRDSNTSESTESDGGGSPLLRQTANLALRKKLARAQSMEEIKPAKQGHARQAAQSRPAPVASTLPFVSMILPPPPPAEMLSQLAESHGNIIPLEDLPPPPPMPGGAQEGAPALAITN